MTTLRHLVLLLLSTIFTSPALSSAINILRKTVSDETATTSSTASTFPLDNNRGIIPTPPTIPSQNPTARSFFLYESTDIHLDSPTQTSKTSN
ncbi:hypothetical protein QR685DRAFT_557258 [Neurospora intermedia]|uniref:Uncharacterized protein n=1 Tax=Neurospora intermedia TaxID=5142 RepID=A0ABR3D0W0_NEUIN